jgi:hypothetical protein
MFHNRTYILSSPVSRESEEILNAKAECIKESGRPGLGWENGMDNDVKALVERNWKNLDRNIEIWQSLVRKAVKRAVLRMVMMSNEMEIEGILRLYRHNQAVRGFHLA